MNEWIRRSGKSLSLLSFSPGIMLVFVQKITFILMKIHKNCCHQSCSFWLKYAPNRFSAGAFPQTPLGSLQCSPRPPSCIWGPILLRGVGAGEGRERMREEGREVREEKGVNGREGKGGERRRWEGGSSSFALKRKRKVGAYGPRITLVVDVQISKLIVSCPVDHLCPFPSPSVNSLLCLM